MVNKHMKVLAAAGVLSAEKEGRTVWYAARCGDLCERFARLIDAIAEWCPNLPQAGRNATQHTVRGVLLMERREWTKLASLAGLFLGVYLLPIGSEPVERAVGEGLRLTQWYAREHVILCLLPAFLIAGAIAAFVDKAAILKYLGPGASKPTAYGVGATSGCVMAVCSCTVLPLFAGIYRMGAGLGPGDGFPLRRAGDQCAGGHPHRSCARHRDRDRASRGCSCLQCVHRADHGRDLRAIEERAKSPPPPCRAR